MSGARFAFGLGTLAALAFAACTGESVLSSLAPFPCAKDNHCPDGYTCQADAGCVASGLGYPGSGNLNVDDPCMSSDECPNGQSCTYGVCPQPKNGTGQCAPGRVEVVSGCLVDCSLNPCPGALQCIYAPLSGGGVPQKVCVSPAQAAVQDTVCDPRNTTPCPLYGATSPYACIAGACVLSCGYTNGCPSGRVCVDPQHPDAGYSAGCFFDCSSTSGECPVRQMQCSNFTGGVPGSYCYYP